MGIGNKKILSEVRKVRQVSSFRNSLLRFPARGKSQPIRYLGLFRLLCVSGAFSLAPKRTLDLHLAYFSETLYSASPQTNKKALILLRIRAFSNFCFLEKRCVRDSNPWPHAWQACILTNWTNAPSFHFIVAISLDCGCKGRCFFWICNSCDKLFFKSSCLCLLFVLIFRKL